MISLGITAFEQGTITGAGAPSSSTTRVRTSGYIVLENSFSLASLSVVSTTGKAVQWSFVGYGLDGKMVCNHAWNASGATVDITPYIGKIATFRSVLCYTAGGNITPGEIDSAVMTLYTGWTVSDGVLDSDCLPDRISMPQYAMTKPYPAALWRIKPGVNEGRLYHELLPDLQGVDVWALERQHEIRVYSLNEPQNGFTGNGLAVLDPVSCVSKNELNGRWDVTLVHPLDEWQKWKHLVCQNVLKINGQLFRIDMHEPEIDYDRQQITVHANHIFYDLADEKIAQASRPYGSAAAFMDFVFSNLLSKVGPWDYGGIFTPYEFSHYTDINKKALASDFFNVSAVGAMIGEDGCFVKLFGGELYRDNFYFSICSRMQYSRENAFKLRYSVEMEHIRQTVDFSCYRTEIHAYDNFGNYYSQMTYDSTSGNHWVIHHPKPEIVQFNFSDNGGIEQLSAVANAYFDTIKGPKVTYEVGTAALSRIPEYAGFTDLLDVRLGDTGTVYCSELGVETLQEVTAVERNELTGENINVVLGSVKSSYYSPGFFSGTITSGKTAEDKQNRAMQELMIGSSIANMQKFPISRLIACTIAKLQGG